MNPIKLFLRFRRWWMIHHYSGQAYHYAAKYNKISNRYSCGNKLMEYMNPNLVVLRLRYDNAVEKVKKLKALS